jgi:predicted dehydrogenase
MSENTLRKQELIGGVSAKPKIVLVGAGRFGKNHLRVLKELEEEGLCTLYGVVDKRAAVLENVKKTYGVSTTSNLSDFLNGEADAVDIVTPSDTHFELCKECLESDKHVLVEKPLTTCYADARKLVQLAARREKILMVGHIFRYNPAVREIKELISRGELGKIYYMFGHYMGFKDPRAELGALLNFAIHQIDIYDCLFDDVPEEVTCNTAHFLGRKEFEDFAVTVLKYRTGALGIIESSWLPPGNYRDLTIIGSKKSLSSDLAKQTIMVHDVHMEKQNDTLKAVDNGSLSVDVKFEEPLKLELKDFAECINTGRKPLANGQVGLRTIMIAEKALQSARLKRSVRIR